MSICAKCGNSLDEGLRLCPSCGAPVDGAALPADSGASPPPEPASPPASMPVQEKKPPNPKKKRSGDVPKRQRKRRKRRIKKRFFAFLGIVLLLLGGTAALLVLRPWKTQSPVTDPFLGTWTARRVVYMQSEYAAAQLFPNGVPELTISKYRVALSFSGNSGKGRRHNLDGAIQFSCLGKTYIAQFADGVLSMDMTGMTLYFSQAPDADVSSPEISGEESGSPLLGTWTAEAYTSDSHGPGYASDLFKTGCTIRLNSGGSGTITVDAYTEQIEWAESENRIAIDGTIMFPELELRDGLLYGVYGRSGMTLRFIKAESE